MKTSASTEKKPFHHKVGNRLHPQQIKGRNFEVPGCEGFLLTEPAANLGDYYEFDQEVVRFQGVENPVEKTRYYLRQDDERAEIAPAGYRRTLNEHTYVHGFTELFSSWGFHEHPF